MPLTTEQLIEATLKQKLIEPDMLAQLRMESRRKRIDLLETISAHYRFPTSAFYRAAAEARGLKFADFSQLKPDVELLKKYRKRS